MEEKLVLRMDSIVKTFPGVKALDGVHLDVRRGEVHALCGENGAGKSTLMKIIAGAQGYTSGHMYVNGEEVVFHSTKDAERKGIAMIYQEFNMVRDLSVAENMYLGRLPKMCIRDSHRIFHAHRQKGGILSHLWWVSLLYVYIPLFGALIISAQI